jgi:glutamyl-tRNA(Gln) amidotransferase subunit E
LSEDFIDVSKIFEHTQSKVISSGESILGVKVPKFSGILGEEILTGVRFGSEIANIVRVKTGLKGIIHTDELPGYGITEEEVRKLKNFVKAKDEDSVVIVVGEREKALQALKEVVSRVKQAFDGVPREVRVANPDGTTNFLRPLAGAARMYPETDVEPIKIDKKSLNEIKKQLPENWDKKLIRFKEELKLPGGLAEQMIKSEYLSLFEKIIEKIKIDPILIATTFVYTLKELRRNSIPVENLTHKNFSELFKLVRQKKLVKEGIPSVLEKLSYMPDKSTLSVVNELKLSVMSESELRQLVKEKIKMNRIRLKDKDIAHKFLMGIVMKEVRGRIDGKIVNKVVDEEMNKLARK